jgi:hypothetical protein
MTSFVCTHACVKISSVQGIQYSGIQKPSEHFQTVVVHQEFSNCDMPARFSKLSTEEGKMLQQLRSKAGCQLTTIGLFDNVPGEEEFECVSMTGGSKRRLAADVPSMDGYGKTDVKKIGKLATGKIPALTVALPPGVADVETWGRTIMENGKFSHRSLAHEEMRTSAELPVSSYVDWLTAFG